MSQVNEKQPDYTTMYVSFLQGSSEYPNYEDGFVMNALKCLKYVISKQNYHRENTLYAIADLMTRKFTDEQSKKLARQGSWELIQELPLSHLIEFPGILKEKKIKTPKRFRNAIMYALATTTSKTELDRAFFFGPTKFKELFTYFYLPTEQFKNKPILNSGYRYALGLYKEGSITNLLEKHGVRYFIKDLHIPMHLVMQYITSQEDAFELAGLVKEDDFFRHAQWFRQIMGDELFIELSTKKANQIKDPVSFLRIKEHLAEKGIMSSSLQHLIEERSQEIMTDMVKKANINGLALLVDISGSMDSAKVISNKLYQAFQFMGGSITDLIAFNTNASNVNPQQLPMLYCSSSTSIGSAFQLLYSNFQKRHMNNLPQAIILVTDMGENSSPNIPQVISLFKNNLIPVIVLFLGRGDHKANLFMNHPVSYLEINDFHDRLLQDIIKQIISLTGKVAVQEKEITQTVTYRKPLEEEIMGQIIELRLEKTLKPGFFELLLTHPAKSQHPESL